MASRLFSALGVVLPVPLTIMTTAVSQASISSISSIGAIGAIGAITAQPALLADESLIIGGSGDGTSPDVAGMVDRYITPKFPGFTTENASGLPTPGGLYPLTGVKSLPLNTSVDQGTQILHNAVTESGPGGFNGDSLVVLGYSQSAIVATQEMEALAEPGADVPAPDRLAFVLLADPMNPNGGILERFAGLTLPSLGLDFSGATPPDTSYPTDVYTLEYDPIADYPRYPLDLLADINAVLGAVVHGTYPSLPQDQIDAAKLLPGSAELTGEGTTNYYIMPIDDLPLLSPLRQLPVLGNPLADLVQPDLRVLVNLGYGDPDFGWSTAPANLPTEFGLFPSLSDLAKVPGLLVSGARQGIGDFVKDLSSPGAGDHTATLDSALDSGSPTDLLTNFVNALSGGAAGGYAALLPTADILNAAATSLPAYDATLFVDALSGGDLVGAIGNPIAADLGLGTMAAGFELLVVTEALASMAGIFNGS